MDYIRYLRSMVGPKPVIMMTAGVVIFNSDGELLLQHRADGNGWGLIGGFMELGETVEETARREVLEETGLTLGRLELLGVFSSAELLTAPGGDVLQIVHIAYVTDEVGGTLQADEEGLELRYFPLDALPKNLFAPSAELFTAVRQRFGKDARSIR